MGEISEDFLFAHVREARDHHRRSRDCQAHFYAAMMRLLTGDVTGARQHFAACLATDFIPAPEYVLARGELERLNRH